MGMMLRRHYVKAQPVKPVEQPKAETIPVVQEMPKKEEKQADDVAVSSRGRKKRS